MLKIARIGDKAPDKNGRMGRMITFRQVNTLPTGQLVFTNQSSTRWIWEAKDDFKADELYIMIDEQLVKVGSDVAGDIYSYNTTSYKIENKEVTRYTFVAFQGEDPISLGNRNLKANKASILDELGTVTNPDNLKETSVIA